MISALVLMTLAKCASVYRQCDCPSTWAVVGTVTTAVDGGTVISGGTTFGPAPAEVAVTADAGARLLVTDLGQLPVDTSGLVFCSNAVVDAMTYAPTIVDGSCVAALKAAGLKEPPCHDTGFWPFCGCSTSVTNVSLAALIIAAIRWRMRRRADL